MVVVVAAVKHAYSSGTHYIRYLTPALHILHGLVSLRTEHYKLELVFSELFSFFSIYQRWTGSFWKGIVCY